MSNIRRWYVFLVCGISLQSITWAVIFLLRSLLWLGDRTPAASIAFQIAVIIVGLPVFLLHWLWAQRLSNKDPDERGNLLRRVRFVWHDGRIFTPLHRQHYRFHFQCVMDGFPRDARRAFFRQATSPTGCDSPRSHRHVRPDITLDLPLPSSCSTPMLFLKKEAQRPYAGYTFWVSAGQG